MPNTSRSAEPKRPADIGRVLVVGGSGKLGRLLRLAWNAAGQGGLAWQDRRVGPLVFDPLAESERFAAAAEGTDAILNLAGPTGGDAKALEVHTDLALAALQAGRDAGAGRVFLVSSAAVYGAPTGPASEVTALSPLADYGRAKQEMEQRAWGWRATAGPIPPEMTILRIGNVAGADQLLGAVPRAEPQALDLFADGRGPARSYIGPLALARVLAALFAMSRKGQALPEVLNVALDGTVRMDELLDADGRDWRARPAPETLPREVALDVARLRGLVSWLPRAEAGQVAADYRAVVAKGEGTR
ncbi:hypothetical protein DEA8626_00388 [Defluviimonas aquaemixtae]|uniref:NAD-dependent epimerase/dehydratase domain-containing protein n=1 Tax=Albidovulum aquaemixtae TaxID=1542388 RepID=A0A2R8B2L5_9RHOB|nr:NAD-dependent epimerase/dehydratase family protein [Defluviimonas aquaemixtae]SPH16874.1 hypothetical protein DEA8626_00388 [Defluviimonas aquaemixtae]